MTKPPPSRWKVIERGRRLEVIDTHSGTRSGSAEPARASAAAGGGSRWLRKVRFDGSSELTTHPLYDARGPRTIPLDPAAARIVGLAMAGGVLAATALIVAAVFWPAILLVLVPLMQGRTRAPLRRAATRWLDARDRDAA